MSGFEYHLRCPGCRLKSPVLSFGGNGPDHIPFLAAVATSRRFETVLIPRDAVTDKTPLRVLAACATDETRQVTVARPGEGGELELQPPLACPRCATVIARAEWGGPQPDHRVFLSVEQVVEESRALPDDDEWEFVSPELEGCEVSCERGTEEGVAVIFWDLRQAPWGEVDLASLTAELVGRLRAIGSRCTEPYSWSPSYPTQLTFTEYVA